MKKQFLKFFVEKNVLGLEEFIDIENVGKFQAKLDTGNGAHCVLHGTDIKFGKNKVAFITDIDGTPKKVIAPLVDTIVINVGAGNKEDRPVVTFNVKIGDMVFQNVPFSIGDRSENTHKVLIGKDFIENELDALIDVGLTYAAEDGIEVNY